MTPTARRMWIALLAPLLACCALVASADDRNSAWNVYGQLNFGLMRVDDGAGEETYFAENPHVPSRLGLQYRFGTVGNGDLSFVFETGFGLTNLSQVSPTNDDLRIDFTRQALRRVELIFASADWGQISLGQGSMASDGASGTDLSGTALAHGPAIGDLGGATAFRFTNGTASTFAVADVFDDLDGPRRLRIRYDTPNWNGLSFAAAYGQEVLRSGNDLDYRDVAVRYARETKSVMAEAAASYEWIGGIEERVLVSAALLHKPSGLNISIAHGSNQIGQGRYVYGKLGWTLEVVATGPTAVALEYYDGDSFGFTGSSSRAVGIGISQSIAALNLDIFAAHRRYSLSSASDNYEDIIVSMIGARWRF